MEPQIPNPKRILVIAGSDSSGGAGLEADQKVIAAYGCYAMTATTALTAQNTRGVSAIHYVPSDFVVNQIDQCIDDIGIDIVKIGMLASASTANAVADALRRHGRPKTVLDPVMVSTSGAQLLPSSAVSSLLTHLLPITTILTPNISEAKLLLHHAGIAFPKDISSLADLVTLATHVYSLGPRHVLLKGGHFPLSNPRKPTPNHLPRPVSSSESAANHKTDEPAAGDENGAGDQNQGQEKVVIDVLVSSSPSSSSSSSHSSSINPIDALSIPAFVPPASNRTIITLYQSPYISTPNTHGTGCSLASAIACNLALDEDKDKDVDSDVRAAVADSVRYLHGAIRGAKEWRMGGQGEGGGGKAGKGGGPVDHLFALRRRWRRRMRGVGVREADGLGRGEGKNGEEEEEEEGESEMVVWEWDGEGVNGEGGKGE